ncbi:hypothetical protein IHE45_12G060600 [Dioscorea alata]|uniref:Uncharacterized protein n=1 Tax=Dioscorea alata TaxID=55571 RepID=A0ACB7V2Q2_DIOAL|nr:hypothetical protein IHE45_12G060600 [Dioscorea alata]
MGRLLSIWIDRDENFLFLSLMNGTWVNNTIKESDIPHDFPLLGCCCCPSHLVTFLFRMIGWCSFVACYPILQCLALDEHRRHHHHHHHHLSHFR